MRASTVLFELYILLASAVALFASTFFATLGEARELVVNLKTNSNDHGDAAAGSSTTATTLVGEDFIPLLIASADSITTASGGGSALHITSAARVGGTLLAESVADAAAEAITVKVDTLVISTTGDPSPLDKECAVLTPSLPLTSLMPAAVGDGSRDDGGGTDNTVYQYKGVSETLSSLLFGPFDDGSGAVTSNGVCLAAPSSLATSAFARDGSTPLAFLPVMPDGAASPANVGSLIAALDTTTADPAVSSFTTIDAAQLRANVPISSQGSIDAAPPSSPSTPDNRNAVRNPFAIFAAQRRHIASHNDDPDSASISPFFDLVEEGSIHVLARVSRRSRGFLVAQLGKTHLRVGTTSSPPPDTLLSVPELEVVETMLQGSTLLSSKSSSTDDYFKPLATVGYHRIEVPASVPSTDDSSTSVPLSTGAVRGLLNGFNVGLYVDGALGIVALVFTGHPLDDSAKKSGMTEKKKTEYNFDLRGIDRTDADLSAFLTSIADIVAMEAAATLNYLNPYLEVYVWSIEQILAQFGPATVAPTPPAVSDADLALFPLTSFSIITHRSHTLNLRRTLAINGERLSAVSDAEVLAMCGRNPSPSTVKVTAMRDLIARYGGSGEVSDLSSRGTSVVELVVPDPSVPLSEVTPTTAKFPLMTNIVALRDVSDSAWLDPTTPDRPFPLVSEHRYAPPSTVVSFLFRTGAPLTPYALHQLIPSYPFRNGEGETEHNHTALFAICVTLLVAFVVSFLFAFGVWRNCCVPQCLRSMVLSIRSDQSASLCPATRAVDFSVIPTQTACVQRKRFQRIAAENGTDPSQEKATNETKEGEEKGEEHFWFEKRRPYLPSRTASVATLLIIMLWSLQLQGVYYITIWPDSSSSSSRSGRGAGGSEGSYYTKHGSATYSEQGDAHPFESVSRWAQYLSLAFFPIPSDIATPPEIVTLNVWCILAASFLCCVVMWLMMTRDLETTARRKALSYVHALTAKEFIVQRMCDRTLLESEELTRRLLIANSNSNVNRNPPQGGVVIATAEGDPSLTANSLSNPTTAARKATATSNATNPLSPHSQPSAPLSAAFTALPPKELQPPRPFAILTNLLADMEGELTRLEKGRAEMKKKAPEYFIDEGFVGKNAFAIDLSTVVDVDVPLSLLASEPLSGSEQDKVAHEGLSAALPHNSQKQETLSAAAVATAQRIAAREASARQEILSAIAIATLFTKAEEQQQQNTQQHDEGDDSAAHINTNISSNPSSRATTPHALRGGSQLSGGIGVGRLSGVGLGTRVMMRHLRTGRVYDCIIKGIYRTRGGGGGGEGGGGSSSPPSSTSVPKLWAFIEVLHLSQNAIAVFRADLNVFEMPLEKRVRPILKHSSSSAAVPSSQPKGGVGAAVATTIGTAILTVADREEANVSSPTSPLSPSSPTTNRNASAFSSKTKPRRASKVSEGKGRRKTKLLSSFGGQTQHQQQQRASNDPLSKGLLDAVAASSAFIEDKVFGDRTTRGGGSWWFLSATSPLHRSLKFAAGTVVTVITAWLIVPSLWWSIHILLTAGGTDRRRVHDNVLTCAWAAEGERSALMVGAAALMVMLWASFFASIMFWAAWRKKNIAAWDDDGSSLGIGGPSSSALLYQTKGGGRPAAGSGGLFSGSSSPLPSPQHQPRRGGNAVANSANGGGASGGAGAEQENLVEMRDLSHEPRWYGGLGDGGVDAKNPLLAPPPTMATTTTTLSAAAEGEGTIFSPTEGFAASSTTRDSDKEGNATAEKDAPPLLHEGVAENSGVWASPRRHSQPAEKNTTTTSAVNAERIQKAPSTTSAACLFSNPNLSTAKHGSESSSLSLAAPLAVLRRRMLTARDLSTLCDILSALYVITNNANSNGSGTAAKRVTAAASSPSSQMSSALPPLMPIGLSIVNQSEVMNTALGKSTAVAALMAAGGSVPETVGGGGGAGAGAAVNAFEGDPLLNLLLAYHASHGNTNTNANNVQQSTGAGAPLPPPLTSLMSAPLSPVSAATNNGGDSPMARFSPTARRNQLLAAGGGGAAYPTPALSNRVDLSMDDLNADDNPSGSTPSTSRSTPFYTSIPLGGKSNGPRFPLRNVIIFGGGGESSSSAPSPVSRSLTPALGAANNKMNATPTAPPPPLAMAAVPEMNPPPPNAIAGRVQKLSLEDLAAQRRISDQMPPTALADEGLGDAISNLPPFVASVSGAHILRPLLIVIPPSAAVLLGMLDVGDGAGGASDEVLGWIPQPQLQKDSKNANSTATASNQASSSSHPQQQRGAAVAFNARLTPLHHLAALAGGASHVAVNLLPITALEVAGEFGGIRASPFVLAMNNRKHTNTGAAAAAALLAAFGSIDGPSEGVAGSSASPSNSSSFHHIASQPPQAPLLQSNGSAVALQNDDIAAVPNRLLNVRRSVVVVSPNTRKRHVLGVGGAAAETATTVPTATTVVTNLNPRGSIMSAAAAENSTASVEYSRDTHNPDAVRGVQRGSESEGEGEGGALTARHSRFSDNAVVQGSTDDSISTFAPTPSYPANTEDFKESSAAANGQKRTSASTTATGATLYTTIVPIIGVGVASSTGAPSPTLMSPHNQVLSPPSAAAAGRAAVLPASLPSSSAAPITSTTSDTDLVAGPMTAPPHTTTLFLKRVNAERIDRPLVEFYTHILLTFPAIVLPLLSWFLCTTVVCVALAVTLPSVNTFYAHRWLSAPNRIAARLTLETVPSDVDDVAAVTIAVGLSVCLQVVVMLAVYWRRLRWSGGGGTVDPCRSSDASFIITEATATTVPSALPTASIEAETSRDAVAVLELEEANADEESGEQPPANTPTGDLNAKANDGETKGRQPNSLTTVAVAGALSSQQRAVVDASLTRLLLITFASFCIFSFAQLLNLFLGLETARYRSGNVRWIGMGLFSFETSVGVSWCVTMGLFAIIICCVIVA